MIALKILLLFLISNNLIHVEAQLNKCKTPEGNEGYCMNIWECSLRLKYIFSEKQNSLQTYNILKSVCDYTNSIVKLCCPLSSNTKQNPILQEDTENFTDQKVHDKFNTNTYNNRISRQDFIFFKNNADCNDDNSTEEILTKQSNSSDILELEETENKKKYITSKDDQYDGILNNISPIDGQINETNVTEMVKDESEEVATTESSNVNYNENSTAINKNINLIRSNSELSLFKQEDNEVTEPLVRNKNINFVQESENNSDLDILDPIPVNKKNISEDLKAMMNTENQIINNTIIIINMRDNSTIFNNNNNAEESVTQEDKDTTNISEKISMDLFKKILCLILSKNSELGTFPLIDSTKSAEDDPNSSNISTEDDSNSSNISTENLPVVSNISLENINSSEANSLQKPVENISSSENNSFQNSTENISLESKDSQQKIDNSLENDSDISSFLSDENDKEVFQYVSFPNPPHCGRIKKSLVVKGEYAWEVLLKERNKKYTKNFCKGTLITRQHIVTTAYCIKTREIESVLIFSKNIFAYITLKIKDIRVHEHFVPKYIQNDIALITLKGPIKLGEISPICLMVDSYLTKNLTGVYAFSPGYWKENHKNAGKPGPKVEKLICESECANELNDSEEYMNIDESILCAKPKTNSEDICLGNEGSPLVIAGKFNDSKKYYYQIGIVSGVNFCDENHYPNIFVNINLYLNWILKNM